VVQVATVADLYRNTLQDLGLDGNGLLRLNFRPTETTLEGVQAELEALQASEAQRLEQHKKAEERKAQLKAAEMERVKRLTEESEKMLDAEREELLRRGKEEAEAEEEARRKQEIERLVAQKEKEMEETFREMERAAFEQTQVEHMRAAMRCVLLLLLLRTNLLSLLPASCAR
jgi:flagellar biosynthesis GTPase FlhF